MPKPAGRTRSRLSELEGAVLGLVWRAGPITAHAVRTTFLASPTDHFSGSAGAIYPLVRRLDAEGLIEPCQAVGGAKGGTTYTLTPAGRDALRAWIEDGDSASLASVTFDPLRTRVLSLALLPPRRRARFLQQAEAELSTRVASERATLRDCRDEWSRAACHGALAVMRARLRWIRSLRQLTQ